MYLYIYLFEYVCLYVSVVGEKRVKRTPFFVQKKWKHILPADLDM